MSTKSNSKQGIDHLCLCPISVNDIHVDSIIDQLMKQIFGSVFGLYKYQHRRLNTLHISTV